MDVLSEVLRAIRLTGAIFFNIEWRAPWVAETPAAAAIAANVMPEAEHIITFHAIAAGTAWAETLDGASPPLLLKAGDILMMPTAEPHVLASAPGLRAAPNLAHYYRPADRQLPFIIGPNDGTGERTHFVCGYLGCDARLFNPILKHLPRLLHATASESAGSIQPLFQLAALETAAPRPGGETVLSKIAELMFVDVVRRHIASLPADAAGWLSGLRDPQIGGALALLHGRPAETWTVERLAREVGMSRSAFAARFAYFVQETPMQYLTRWRMQLATRLLERPGAGVAQVAAEVGYESEAAFNRAFKKSLGAPPGSWRRSRQAAAIGKA